MSDDEKEQPTADVSLRVPGIGEANVKNIKSVNTILTAGAFGGIAFAIYLLLFPLSQALEQHRSEAKDMSTAFVTAIKEQTVAMRDSTAAAREQNCLLRFEQKERQQNADFCRQVTR